MNHEDMRRNEELLEMYRFRRPTIFFFCNLIENRIRQMYKFGFFPKGAFTGVFESRCLRCFPAANCSALISMLGDESGGNDRLSPT